jgi:hypothetical protein
MNFKITKKPTCLAKIRSPVSKNFAVFAILLSLQPIRWLEPSLKPLHVLPLENILDNEKAYATTLIQLREFVYMIKIN